MDGAGESSGRRSWRLPWRVAWTFATVVVATLTPAQPALADDTVEICVDDVQLGSREGWQMTTSVTYDVELGAGRHTVEVDVHDEHSIRHLQYQDREQILVEFLFGGIVVGATGPSPDLEDRVNETSWSGPIGRIDVPDRVDAIRVRHAFEGSGPTPNSLYVDCVRTYREVVIPIADPGVGVILLVGGGLGVIARRRLVQSERAGSPSPAAHRSVNP